MKTIRGEFLRRVDRSAGCWVWSGRRNAKGYGIFPFAGRDLGAHRVAYEIWNGEIGESSFVLHRCDNPPCVNPSHLLLGTHAENMADRDAKGRLVRISGEKNGMAKSSDATVAEAVRLYMETEMTPREISLVLGASASSVRDWVKGRFRGVGGHK